MLAQDERQESEMDGCQTTNAWFNRKKNPTTTGGRSQSSCIVQRLLHQFGCRSSLTVLIPHIYKHSFPLCESPGNCNGKLAQIVFTSTFNKPATVRCCSHLIRFVLSGPEAEQQQQQQCFTWARTLCHTTVKQLCVLPCNDAVNLMRWRCCSVKEPVQNHWTEPVEICGTC